LKYLENSASETILKRNGEEGPKQMSANLQAD